MILFPALLTAVLVLFGIQDPTKLASISGWAVQLLSLTFIVALAFPDVNTQFIKAKNEWPYAIKVILTGIFLVLVLNTITNGLVRIVLPEFVNTNQESIKGQFATNPIFISIMSVFFAPVIEEMVFRYSLVTFNPKWAFASVILSSLAFAIPHILPALQTGEWINLIQALPYFGMALVFGFSYLRTQSIYVPIAIHMLNNLIALVMLVWK